MRREAGGMKLEAEGVRREDFLVNEVYQFLYGKALCSQPKAYSLPLPASNLPGF
jgi:hypothetical protein